VSVARRLLATALSLSHGALWRRRGGTLSAKGRGCVGKARGPETRSIRPMWGDPA